MADEDKTQPENNEVGLESHETTGARPKIMTEKGRQYNIELKKNYFQSKKTELTKQRRKVVQLKGQCVDLCLWKQEFATAQILYEELDEVKNEWMDIDSSDEGRHVASTKWEQVQSTWNNFESDIRSEIKYLENMEALKFGSDVGGSVKSMIKQDNMERYFKSQQDDPPPSSPIILPTDQQSTPDQLDTHDKLNVHAEPFVIPNQSDESQSLNQPTSSALERVASSLEKCITQLIETNKQQNQSNVKLAVSSQLPKISLPIFTGEPLQYQLWENAFKALIDSRPLDAATKLNYLNQYVAGKPKTVVEHYLLLGTEDAYQQAVKILSDRYGNGSVIATAVIERLEHWPKIGPRDNTGLRDLSDFLDKANAASKTISSLKVLDFPTENVKLVGKLPYYLDAKWRSEIEKWRNTNGKDSYPTFEAFAEFIRSAANKANMPEFEAIKSKNSSRTNDTGGNMQPNRNQKARTFATAVQRSNSTTQSTHNRNTLPGCAYCGNSHNLNQCEAFIKQSFKEKKDFFFRKRLCLGCGTSSSHQVRECRDRKACAICHRQHLTCLHREYSHPTSNLEVTSNCVSVCTQPGQTTGQDHCMIIPVWVRPAGKPYLEHLVYAILDDQSNVGFVSENLCKKLKTEGPETQLLLTTMHERNACITSSRITGLEVLDVNREHVVKLPMCFKRSEVPANQSQIPKQEVVRKWDHLRPIAEWLMPYNPDLEISLLIGNNCPKVLRPREIIAGGENDPYGQRSLLGWGVIGRVCKSPEEIPNHGGVCHRVVAAETNHHITIGTRVKEVFNPERALHILESDFIERKIKGKTLSVEDRQFLNILENGIKKRPDGHYQIPLPLRVSNTTLPNNRQLALKRWNQLNARFRKNPKFFADYKEFMKGVLDNCAERVPNERLAVQDGQINYVPHTGVYHPKKKKIRVVFDCSAQFEGVCLNDCLLQGPDLTNGLIGVLCRFRKEEVAITADVQSMFHQFYVAEENRDLLRFLWWEDNDSTKEVVEYRMTVHLFGAGSSPGCANYGLKKAADDGEAEFGKAAADFIREEFYVDDGLKSVPTETEAINLIKASQGICAKAGLKLHKIISNKKGVLEAIPPEDRADEIKGIILERDRLPMERVLGMSWCIENDYFQFRLELKDRPCTRRGILATVSSIYDPTGFLAPVTLKAKQILQQLCRSKSDWDDPIPENLYPAWERWRTEIMDFEEVKIGRCFKPEGFGVVKLVELHHFSDASEEGYGQCSYLRFVSEQEAVHCAFVIGKARVTPMKQVSIPRLELAAAAVSARMSEFLRAELKYGPVPEFFWTDSKIVLGYIKNEAKRFHVFVANRVQQIRDCSNPEQWFHVETKCNPADEASRGLTVKQYREKSCWLTGPRFLWEKGKVPTRNSDGIMLDNDDPELRKASVFATRVKSQDLNKNEFCHCSSWYRTSKAVALCLRLKQKFLERKIKYQRGIVQIRPLSRIVVTLHEMQLAEKEIVRRVQQEYFAEELSVLQSLNLMGEVVNRKSTKERNEMIKGTSCLYRLDPFLDKDGLIRVGGRIHRANMPTEVKHPLIIPRKGHVSELLIRHHHLKVNHMGRTTTHNELRQKGYWVIGGSSAVSHYISKCVMCKKLRGSLQTQKMATLPEDRLKPAPPFSYCGVDYFGPFTIRERRSEVKRYGVIFTCMASRAVHLETANSLTTNSFINSLRRFLNRRGPVRQIRADQGTNLVGARNELRQALTEMDADKVHEYLLQNGCEWIQFKFNVPHASHMGGSWERQIKTVRSILDTLLTNAGGQLDDESFRTFMSEVEAIINSRPLTTNNLCSPEVPEPLTPNHLLTMKPTTVLPPPGKFQRADIYSRKWWRRVQYLANEFWNRWKKEFLQTLQTRQKWERLEINLKIGDVVLSKEDEGPRGQWPLARIVDTYPSPDGQVRKVRLVMGDKKLNKKGQRRHPPTELDRPIHKLVKLVDAEDAV